MTLFSVQLCCVDMHRVAFNLSGRARPTRQINTSETVQRFVILLLMYSEACNSRFLNMHAPSLHSVKHVRIRATERLQIECSD